MKKSTVFIGGEYPRRKLIEGHIKEFGFIIAADSGIHVVEEYQLNPDLIIGDMDSIKDLSILNSYSKGKIVRYNHDKDETDTEIAIRKAYEMRASDITIIGGGGGRLDHLIALLYLFDRGKRPHRWFTRRDMVLSIENEVKIQCIPGEIVSFFPVGTESATMSSSGLKWPLDSLEWNRGEFGISNIAIEDRVTVRMKTGRLVMIKQISGVTNG
jgi:thiamine pyrophosphokinase